MAWEVERKAIGYTIFAFGIIWGARNIVNPVPDIWFLIMVVVGSYLFSYGKNKQST
jgi:hypothetical protein